MNSLCAREHASGFGPVDRAGLHATNAPPVSTPTSNTILAETSQPFAASNLFTAGDADTHGITNDDFWRDSGAGAGTSRLTALRRKANRKIFVNASQVSQVGYQARPGTDILYARKRRRLVDCVHANGRNSEAAKLRHHSGRKRSRDPSASTDFAIFSSNTGALKLDSSQSFWHVTGSIIQDTGLEMHEGSYLGFWSDNEGPNAGSNPVSLHWRWNGRRCWLDPRINGSLRPGNCIVWEAASRFWVFDRSADV
jgi:hypothetical protein